MVLQPTLTGPTLDLRPTTPTDWPDLFAVASDPELWALHPANDRWQEPVFRRYFADAIASGGSLTIRERATGRVIGASRYRAYSRDTTRCEIGWTFLTRDHWGGATNRELKKLMLRHVFQYFETATFVVGPENHRSRRALEKIGAVLTDEIDTRAMAGGNVDHVVYEMTAGAPFLTDDHYASAKAGALATEALRSPTLRPSPEYRSG